jgi:hypothetical protein
MSSNEVLNEALDKMRKAFTRSYSIERLLRSAEGEYKRGGMEKPIYFATKAVMPQLRVYLQAAYDEEARLELAYTRLVTAEVAAIVRAHEEETEEPVVAEKPKRRRNVKASPIQEALPEMPARKREPKTGEARVQPVAKRQYNKNGTK